MRLSICAAVMSLGRIPTGVSWGSAAPLVSGCGAEGVPGDTVSATATGSGVGADTGSLAAGGDSTLTTGAGAPRS